MSKTNFAKDQLKSLVERIERIEEEEAALKADKREVYAEAKGNGFDAKIIRMIVRERKMDPHERETIEALLELYRAAIGMLNGTPLGDAARKRLSEPKPEDDEPSDDGIGQPAPAEFPPADLEVARKKGREDAAAGKRVIDNPFTAGDPRRAAWDEGWCAEKGSDGMDIPDTWRRTPKKKPEPAKEPEGADA